MLFLNHLCRQGARLKDKNTGKTLDLIVSKITTFKKKVRIDIISEGELILSEYLKINKSKFIHDNLSLLITSLDKNRVRIGYYISRDLEILRYYYPLGYPKNGNPVLLTKKVN